MALEIFCLLKIHCEAGSLTQPMYCYVEMHQARSKDGMRIKNEMLKHYEKCVPPCSPQPLSFFIARPMHTFQYLQQTDTLDRFLSSHFISLLREREERDLSYLVWMDRYVFGERTLKWIRNWLDGCIQRVVVNGSEAQWTLGSSAPSANLQVTPSWVVQLTHLMSSSGMCTNSRSGPMGVSWSWIKLRARFCLWVRLGGWWTEQNQSCQERIGGVNGWEAGQDPRMCTCSPESHMCLWLNQMKHG